MTRALSHIRVHGRRTAGAAAGSGDEASQVGGSELVLPRNRLARERGHDYVALGRVLLCLDAINVVAQPAACAGERFVVGCDHLTTTRQVR